eukprot:gene4911-5557_t
MPKNRQEESDSTENKMRKRKKEEFGKRLKKAENLRKEAEQTNRDAGTESKSKVNEKLTKVIKMLQLPEDWHSMKKADPGELIDSIEKETSRSSSSLESKSFEKFEDLVAAVSGGMVRYGILYPNDASKVKKLRKGQCPVLQPPMRVEELLSQLSSQTEYFKSTATDASKKFAHDLETFGLTAATSVSGNYPFTSAKAPLSHSEESSHQTASTKERFSTYGSVVKYKIYPTKAFRFPENEMKLTSEADCEIKQVSNVFDAKGILQKYGSHIPADTHHLGGVFCDMIDVQTDEEINEEEIIKAASDQLSSEISVGGQGAIFGCGVSGSMRISNSTGKTRASQAQKTNATYTRTIKCFGPDATSIEVFSELLEANNSTWRVIDRGELSNVIPLWELVQKQGDNYQEQANLIEKAWEKYDSISDSNADVIQSLRMFVSGKLEEKRARKLIMSDIFAEIEIAQEKLGETCNATAEVMRMQSFTSFLKSIINDKSAVAAHNLLFGRLNQESCVKIREFVNVDPEVEAFLVKKIEKDREETPKRGEEIETESPVSLCDIPDALLAALGDMEKLKIGVEDCKLKISSILGQIKVNAEEQELYQIVLDKAKSFGYHPDQERFSGDISADVLSTLVDFLCKLIINNWATGEFVEWQCKPKKGHPNEIVATGKVKKVEGIHVFIDWTMKSDGRSTHDLPDKVHFWRLQRVCQANQPDPVCHVGIQWKNNEPSEDPKIHVADLFKDRPLSSPNNKDSRVQLIIDALKHRTDVFKKYTGGQEDNDNDDWCFDGDDGGNLEEHQSDVYEPFSTLIELLSKCNLSARQEIFRKLCDQRYAIPIIYPQFGTKQLVYVVNSLQFTTSKLSDRNLSLVEDTTLPRVAFLSSCDETSAESTHMAKEVFKCNFGSLECEEKIGLVTELTVGFLGNEVDKYQPWLLANVHGNFEPLQDFIGMFADLVLLEVGSDQDLTSDSHLKSLFPGKQIIRWKTDSGKLNVNKKALTISGSFHYVAKQINSVANAIFKKNCFDKTTRQALSNITIEHVETPDQLIGTNSIITEVENTDLSTVGEKLSLQKSYIRECKLRLEMQRIRSDPPTYNSLNMEVDKEVNERRNDASIKIKIPIVEQFVNALQINDKDLRVVILNHFEKGINEKCNSVLREEKKKVNDAWSNYISLKDTDDGREALECYYKSKLALASKSLGFENLWREISHIYVAFPEHYNYLPDLAAQHMIDGFVFEILDGDAGLVLTNWVKAVLQSLNAKLKAKHGHDPLVCVFSIMGTQSTGKSTLLNTMFGCRLKVSAGQCTRGINLQLVKVENREGIFDYILAIDTEGIRSPEFFGTEGSIWRDNRLATFSILPADISIITTVNEEDSAIKEVLPIVMLAFKGSNIAEQVSGRLRSMMFFVYSRVDTSKQALEKFANNRRKLQVELQQAILKIEESNTSLNRFMRDFTLGNNEEDSDVKYIGLLNKGELPPEDTPNFDFGKKVADLREYMLRRLCENDFQSQTLTKWCDYFELVSQCVEATDFELNFKSAMEYQAYKTLRAKIESARSKVLMSYSEQYASRESDILNVQEGQKLEYTDLELKLHSGVEPVILEQGNMIKKLLEEDSFRNFQVSELQSWKDFITHTKETQSKLLKDCHKTQFEYAATVAKYQKSILEKLRQKYSQNEEGVSDKKTRNAIFEVVFEEQLKDAQKNHPTIDVKEKVDKLYANRKDIKTDDSRWSGFKDKFTTVWNYFSGSSKSVDDAYSTTWSDIFTRVMVELDGISHFEAEVVQKIIRLTEELLLEKSVKAKNKQTQVHSMVKYEMVKRLEEVQRKWDESNNIAKKLEKEKAIMKEKFDAMCEGVIGEQAVARDIGEGLKKAASSGFIAFLAKKSKSKIVDKTWISSNEVMQAHVDLKLLSLSKARKGHDVVNAIANPIGFYNSVLSELILKEVEQDITWQYFKTRTLSAVEDATSFASNSRQHERSEVFQHELTTRLDSCLKKHLPATTWFELKEQKGKLKNDSITEIGKKVNGILESLSMPKFSKEDIFKEIKTSLVEDGMPQSQPRCEVPCPRCKMRCHKQMSHVAMTPEEAKHDCKHQPKGLAGVYYVDGKEKDELSDNSCRESVCQGERFLHQGTWHPYADFHIVFDSWKQPELIEVAKVRKYLFRHHQEELAEHYKRKKCSTITGSYSIEELEVELKAKIAET